MKSLIASSILVLAGTIGLAHAQQPPAELLPPGDSLPPAKPRATPAEKAEGKATRKQAGAEAARDFMPGEGDPRPEPTAKVPKAERIKARQDRNAEIRRANKVGEIKNPGEAGLPD